MTPSYTPRHQALKRKSKKKQVAKFIIRTMGLKTHRDTDAVIACYKKRNRNFKCYLCGENFASTKSLNTHFRINHEGLDCMVCDKEFNSPMSLKNTAIYTNCAPSTVADVTKFFHLNCREISTKKYMTICASPVLGNLVIAHLALKVT